MYRWLKQATQSEDRDIHWNFGTYWLVDRTGTPTRFDKVTPNSLQEHIEAALEAAAGSQEEG